MRNLFDFATKELSQDAFLGWLFSNYKDLEDDQKLIRNLLGLFASGNYSLSTIENIEVELQHDRVDVLVKYKVDDVQNYLVMENKTKSYIHSNQLAKYEKNIQKEFNDGSKIHYCYFKLNRFDETTIELSSDKNDWDYLQNHKEWNVVTLRDIYGIVKDYKANNYLINEYINHVIQLYEMYYEQKHYELWDLRAFELFIKKDLCDVFKKDKHKNNWLWVDGGFYKGVGAYDWFRAQKKYKETDYFIELSMQFRISQKHIWADIRLFRRDDTGKDRSVKGDTALKVKKIIEERLGKYFKPRDSKGKIVLASYSAIPELYEEKSKNKFITIIEEIRDLMEKEF